jgi:hypothetical protein
MWFPRIVHLKKAKKKERFLFALSEGKKSLNVHAKPDQNLVYKQNKE